MTAVVLKQRHKARKGVIRAVCCACVDQQLGPLTRWEQLRVHLQYAVHPLNSIAPHHTLVETGKILSDIAELNAYSIVKVSTESVLWRCLAIDLLYIPLGWQGGNTCLATQKHFPGPTPCVR